MSRVAIPDTGRVRLPAYVSPHLLLGLGVVMVGDIVTTYYGLQLGLVEANPLARPLVGQMGLVGMVVVKAVALALPVVTARLTQMPKLAFRASASLCIVIILLVIVNNLLLIATVTQVI